MSKQTAAAAPHYKPTIPRIPIDHTRAPDVGTYSPRLVQSGRSTMIHAPNKTKVRKRRGRDSRKFLYGDQGSARSHHQHHDENMSSAGGGGGLGGSRSVSPEWAGAQDSNPNNAKPDIYSYKLAGTFDQPKQDWTPRQQINLSSRRDTTVMDTDLYLASKLPGPGAYAPPSGFTGRDRTMRRKTELERFNPMACSFKLPDIANGRSPR